LEFVPLHYRSRSATGSHPSGTLVAKPKSDHRASHLLSLSERRDRPYRISSSPESV